MSLSVVKYGMEIVTTERLIIRRPSESDLHSFLTYRNAPESMRLQPIKPMTEDGQIGAEKVRAVEDALKAADKPYTQVVFSQADHGFFCDVGASYNPEAAAQAWPLMLAFLAAHLGA